MFFSSVIHGTHEGEPKSGETSGEIPSARESILAAAVEGLGAERYRRYSVYDLELKDSLNRQLQTLADRLEPTRADLVRCRAAFNEARKRARIREFVPMALLILTLLGLIVFVFPPETAVSTSGLPVPLAVKVMIANPWQGAMMLSSFGLAGIVYVQRRNRLAAVGQARQALDTITLEFKQLHTALVGEAINTALSDVLGPKGLLEFSTQAPRLVELDNATLIASSAVKYLKDFVGGHESSAIGLAGPRGSGKSTLMRALREDASLDPHAVAVSAPVHYDASDFVSRLYRDVAVSVDNPEEGFFKRLGRRRRRQQIVIRFLTSVTALSVGFGLIAADFMPDTLLDGVQLGPLTLLGAAIAGYGLIVYALTLMGMVGRKANTTNSQRLAIDALESLKFDTESNNKSKSALKLFGGFLTLEDEDSVTLKSKTLTHGDLVSGLRGLLRAFADDVYPRPVVVTVDELDKLSDTGDLIDTVNGLKDLFHIKGVHFVVSVSTDALSSFEKRGLSSRDAFDSSFDTIIRVSPLSLRESLDVLAARATGFPPLLGAFCHAWSGGLPRELLRVARRCVEIQRGRNDDVLSTDLFVRTMVSEELVSIIESALNSSEVTDQRGHELWELRSRVKKWERSGLDRHKAPESIDPNSDAISSVAFLGEALIRFYSRSVRGNWIEFDADTQECIEAAADAMSKRAEVPLLRIEAFQEAVLLLDRASAPRSA